VSPAPPPSPARLHDFLDGLPAGVVLFDVEQRVRYVNPAGRAFLADLLGLEDPGEVEQHSGPDMLEALAGTDLGDALHATLAGRTTEARVRAALPGGGSTRVRLTRSKAGVAVHIESPGAGAAATGEGGGVPNDARAMLSLLEQAVQSVQAGVTIADAREPDWPLVYVSEGFSRITGYSTDEVVGRNCRFLQGPETDESVVEGIGDALDKGRALQVTLQNHRKDGTVFWNRLSLSPLRNASGDITHFVGIQEDVTEHRRMGREIGMADRLNSVGSLAGGIAHDMRNVLASAKLLLQLVLDQEGLPQEAKEDLEEADEVLSRGESVTSQLLAFAREQPLEMRVVDLGQVIRDRARFLRRFLRDNISVSVDTRHDLFVEVDEGRLDQVIFNLATNAEQAMPTGGHLDFRLREQLGSELRGAVASFQPELERDFVVVSVQDDGEGMEEAVRSRAFDPFFTGRSESGGTGLGLASVFGTMDQFGGAVWIDSVPGEGTTVHLAFPRTEPPDPEGVSEVEPFSLPTRSLTILLAEDEGVLRRTLSKALSAEGHHVLPAADGDAARALLKTRPDAIDIVISDIMMPEMTGVELAEFVHGLRPELPVLLVSGYSTEQLGHLGRNVRFLSKPFELPTMLSIIIAMTEAESRRGR